MARAQSASWRHEGIAFAPGYLVSHRIPQGSMSPPFFLEKMLPAHYLTNKDVAGNFSREKKNYLKVLSTVNKLGRSKTKIGQKYIYK